MHIGAASIKSRLRDAGVAAGVFVFMGWCAKTALLVFAATAGLALVPMIGPVGATAIVGAGFLSLAGLAYLSYRYHAGRRKSEKRLDTARWSATSLQTQVVQTLSYNLVPLLVAGFATFLVSRLIRRDP
jgi:hypothetical protein